MNSNDLLFEKLLGRRMKEDTISPEMKDEDEKKISQEQLMPHSLINPRKADDKKWNIDFNMWHSVGPINISKTLDLNNDLVLRSHSQQYLDAKMEMVHNALSLTTDKEEMSKMFLAMSSSSDNCVVIRETGCIPLLVQLIHNEVESELVRSNALQVIRNIVHHNPNDKHGRVESRVLRSIDQLMEYCDHSIQNGDGEDNHPCSIIALLMKLSFDGEHRQAMSQLGAVYVIAKFIQKDHELHSGNGVSDITGECVTVRRYAMMTLTNLTFGDGKSKALLCSLKPFLSALINQLNSHNEDLCQGTANVLRNLSWRADTVSKQTLQEFGAVIALMKTALRVKNESTLKSVLSALWNFSAHCNLNKIDICNVDGAIEYLVHMLTYQAPSKTLVVVENAGGILRNISSIIATREDYRNILRNNNCLPILVHQLESTSLQVTSNACGALWNLSARNVTDQRTLWELGAVPMLRRLTHSNHRMISMGSAAALKNLLSSRPDCELSDKSNNKPLPALLAARKRRALQQEFDPSLSETCDNLEQIESWDSFILTSSLSSSANKTDNNCVSYSENNTVSSCPLDVAAVDDAEKMIQEMDINSVKTKSFDTDNSLVTYKVGELKDTKSEYRKIEEPYADEGYTNNYTETDLDQPRDYSLQDVENDTVQTYYKDVENDTVQTYYTEDTPYNFSSSNSMLNLHQAITDIPKHSERDASPSQYVEANKNRSPEAVEDNKDPNKNIESKNVSFDTPMMFSRSSSIGSLSSVEQPDDHNSVISEFSRLPSGIISPSELPDSPTETVPPSPPRRIESSVYRKIPIISTTTTTDNDEGRNGNVFDDCTKNFEDESTPMQFSTATSLSSLTFEDDIRTAAASNNNNLPVLREVTSEQVSVLKDFTSPLKNKICYVAPMIHGVTINPPPPPPPEDDDIALDDEELSLEEQHAMLDACIKSAIIPDKIKKSETTFRKNSKIAPIQGTVRTTNISTSSNSSSNLKTTRKLRYSPSNSISEDATVNFCTEDTPVSISHAASNSDLSILCPSEDSFLRDSLLPLTSSNDDEIELSLEEQKKLLRECIKTGLETLNAIELGSEIDEEFMKTTCSLDEVVDDLPANEQKYLLKKCILAGINSVATTNSSKIEKNNTDLLDKQKKLLKQCIQLGINNIKDASCDLENIGPPSFLAEANLENSLTNVDSIVSEIANSPTITADDITLVEDAINSSLMDDDIIVDIDINDQTVKEKHTPKEKRRQIRDRYSTYTINGEKPNFVTGVMNSNEAMENIKNIMERPRKSFLIKERRSADKDRFKTRTLNESDFNQIASLDKFNHHHHHHHNQPQPHHHNQPLPPYYPPPSSDKVVLHHSKNSRTKTFTATPSPLIRANSSETTTSKTNNFVKPLMISSKVQQKVKSGIPVINKPKISLQIPTNAASSCSVKSKIPTKLSTSMLQRQGTFTKDDTPASPPPIVSPSTKKNSVYKDVPRRNFPAAKLELVKNTKLRSSYAGVKNDFVQNRWSASENSINTVSSLKSCSNGNLNNIASTAAVSSSKIPSSQKKGVTSKIASLWKRTQHF